MAARHGLVRLLVPALLKALLTGHHPARAGDSNKRGELVWSANKVKARPGRLLRVEALLRALIEQLHRQDGREVDPEFGIRLLLRQAADWYRRSDNAQQRVRFFLLAFSKMRREHKQLWSLDPSSEPAEYCAALPIRFSSCSPLEISKRSARLQEIDEDITFDKWRKAIIEFDEEWHTQLARLGTVLRARQRVQLPITPSSQPAW